MGFAQNSLLTAFLHIRVQVVKAMGNTGCKADIVDNPLTYICAVRYINFLRGLMNGKTDTTS
ncbi:hypothetical protein, partial [Treponema sp. OMZ 840]|uniref:hypothetical protein n=1 Tax=Treponema sp. OMZ 840 TaxID=244313 RepID=UPI003D8E4040